MQKPLETYLQNLTEISKSQNYGTPETFINLPFDENNMTRIMEKAKKYEGTENTVVIGIGGSCLGAKAIYEALNTKERNLGKIFFLDQVNLEKIREVVVELKTLGGKTAIITISKSGKTFETLKNYEILSDKLPDHSETGEIFITESGSPLEKSAHKKGKLVLNIPEKVGGRFSVFSAVGLFPLALAKIDIIELLKGGMEAQKEGLAENSNELPAGIQTVFENYRHGMEIYNIFVFSPRLKTLGFWYQQLLAESLGKKGVGLFPTVSEGSKDLHSLQQYFVGGKQNVQHEFIITEDENQYQKSILQAVQETYKEKSIPFRTTTLQKSDENSLGFFMETKMIETLLLAKLLDINPFGQPDVESYKKKIKEA